MIESVQITNYRGFQDLKLKNLSRINVLVGDNGSGKTAFLESLFLAGGLGPEIYLRTRAWRGSGDKLVVGLDRDQYEALWREIFYNLDQNKPVTITFNDSARGGQRQLRIYYDTEQTSLLHLDMSVRTSDESGDIHPITFHWKTDEGADQKASVTVSPGPQSVMQLSQITNVYPMVFFGAGSAFAPEENAKRFSFLSRRKEQQSVIKIIQSLFPLVQDLSVELVAGAPGLYATVPDLQEKISVGSLSAGLTKLLAILCGIASYRKGVVIVDELENGFFYKKYGAVWEGLTSLAEQHQTQLFISSHSIECLQAALPIVARNPTLFTLLRTERKQDECTIKYFDGKDFQAGLEQRIDFR